MYNKSITKPILLGLVMLAVSVAMASGRKPVEEYPAIQMVEPSKDEKIMIGQKFVQSGAKGDVVKYPRSWKKYESHPLLSIVLPQVIFYKLYSAITLPETPFLQGFCNNKFYSLPAGFNQLLLDNSIEIDEDNIIELAKAFVIVALMDYPPVDYTKSGWQEKLNEVPQITFLEGKRIQEKTVEGIRWDAEIKCRIGDGEIQTWKFCQTLYRGKGKWEELGQFYDVVVIVNGKPIRGYDVRLINEKTKGDLDFDIPRINITTNTGYATIENDSFHYLITYQNGAPTNYWLRFRLDGFTPGETIHIKIIPLRGYTYGPADTLGPVYIAQDSFGEYDWQPSQEIQTGICDVIAGTIAQGDTFIHKTRKTGSLTLEKVRTKHLPQSTDSIYLYWTDQFFSDGYSDTNYVNYVLNAMSTCWDSLVNYWNFAAPPDSNRIHQLFLGDIGSYFHGIIRSYGTSTSGENRKIRIADETPIIHPYTSYSPDSAFLSVVSHDFYHGIQWGYNGWKLNAPNDGWKEWRYFLEGQAVFLQTMLCSNEEFKSELKYYPIWVNEYLQNHLNTSLKNDTHAYCLYWRYLYENYKQGSTQEKLAIIRDAYRATNNVMNDPIVDGEIAMDAALSAGGGCFSCFDSSIANFAIACYTTNFNPSNVYVKPNIEATHSLFHGSSSVVVNGSIPYSFGIDYIKLIPVQACSLETVYFYFTKNNEYINFLPKFIIHRQTGSI